MSSGIAYLDFSSLMGNIAHLTYIDNENVQALCFMIRDKYGDKIGFNHIDELDDYSVKIEIMKAAGGQYEKIGEETIEASNVKRLFCDDGYSVIDISSIYANLLMVKLKEIYPL